jgi:hypothetical protein
MRDAHTSVCDASAGVRDALVIMQKLHARERDVLAIERDALVIVQKLHVRECDAHSRERDALVNERVAHLRERDALVSVGNVHSRKALSDVRAGERRRARPGRSFQTEPSRERDEINIVRKC